MKNNIPSRNTIAFSASKGNATVRKSYELTRENVYTVRRLVRVYARKGYHVFTAVNHNGRLLANVFDADIYTQARKREKARNEATRRVSAVILDGLRKCDNEIDYSIAYCDRHSFTRAEAQHCALWDTLVKIDHDSAMAYKAQKDVKDRARRIHA